MWPFFTGRDGSRRKLLGEGSRDGKVAIRGKRNPRWHRQIHAPREICKARVTAQRIELAQRDEPAQPGIAIAVRALQEREGLVLPAQGRCIARGLHEQADFLITAEPKFVDPTHPLRSPRTLVLRRALDRRVRPSLKVESSHGLLATGDDGTSGTAAGYDVWYAPGACPGPSAPGGLGWFAAPRSATTKALASGSAEVFAVRPLAAGSNYCLAIRARDEVPNYSDWALLGGQTGGVSGDWPVASVAPDPSAAAIPANLCVRVRGLVATLDDNPATGEPRVLAAWQITDNPLGVTTDHIIGLRLTSLSAPAADTAPLPICASPGVSDCAETLLLSSAALSAYVDTLSSDLAIAAIPGSDVAGLLVRGSKAATKRTQPPIDKTLLVERTSMGWRSELLPFVLGTGSGEPESTLAYVLDGSGGANPVTTWVRSDGNGRSTLVLAERVAGSWQHSDLFSRVNDGFGVRRLFAAPGGELRIWVAGGSVYNSVYAVGTRASAQSAWGWSHHDAAPATSPDYAVGFDANDELVVARVRVGGSRLLAIRQSAFGGPFAGLPGDGDVGSVGLSAWQEILAPTPGASLSVPLGVSADPCSDAVRIATWLLYDASQLPEVRITPNAFPAAGGATSIALDHVHGGFEAGLVGLPNGDVALLTTWSPFRGTLKNTTRPQQDVYVMRGTQPALGVCP